VISKSTNTWENCIASMAANDTNIAYKEYQYNRVYISYIKEKLKKASHALSGNLL
jgi:hypothetical protein